MTIGPSPPVELETESELRAYLAVLRRRAMLILAVTVIVLLASLFYARSQEPTYRSEAEVLVRPVRLTPIGTSEPAQVEMQDERRVAASREVSDLAEKTLGRPIKQDQMQVEATPEAHILYFTGTGSTAGDAQATTQAFAEAYLQLRREQAVSDLRAVAKPIRAQLQQLQSERRELQDQLNGTTSASRRLTLTSELTAVAAEEANVKQSLNQLVLPEDVSVGDILRPAPLPSSPASPEYLKIGLLALLVGMSLGVGFAFLSDHLDQRIWGREDLELLTGAPVFGSVSPPVPVSRFFGDHLEVNDAGSVITDAYKALRWRLVAATSRYGLSTLMVTSVSREGGRTGLTASLCMALAETGRNVLLVYTELRDSTVAQRSGGPEMTPLRHASKIALATDESSSSDTDEANSTANLWGRMWFLTENLSVLRMPNDFKDLGSEAIRKFLAEMRESPGLIVIDAPPMFEMSDSWMLASEADGVLLVVDAGRSRKEAVRTAKRQLEQADIRMIGTVLVDTPHQARIRPW